MAFASVVLIPVLHPHDSSPAHMRGADALIRALERAGVDTVFGIPGGACLPIYDALHDSPIRHVLMRHEAAAGHAAEGYARATGRIGVAIGTVRPGRDEPRHRDRRRPDGLDPDAVHHRPGQDRRCAARTPSRRRT